MHEVQLTFIESEFWFRIKISLLPNSSYNISIISHAHIFRKWALSFENTNICDLSRKNVYYFKFFFYRMKTCLLFTENQCQTPNGLSGNCIPLQQCTSLYSLISSSITTANRKLLQNSKCGHTEVPYVGFLSGYLHSMVQQNK